MKITTLINIQMKKISRFTFFFFLFSHSTNIYKCTLEWYHNGKRKIDQRPHGRAQHEGDCPEYKAC